MRDCYKEWPCQNSSDRRLWNHHIRRTLKKGIYNLENQSKTKKKPDCLLQSPRINADFIWANFSFHFASKGGSKPDNIHLSCCILRPEGWDQWSQVPIWFPSLQLSFLISWVITFVKVTLTQNLYWAAKSQRGGDEKPAALLLPRCGRWEKREELLSCCHDCKEKGFTMWRANHFKMLHPLRMCMNLEGKFHTKHSGAVIRTSV